MDGSSVDGPGTTGVVVAARLLVVRIGGPPSPCESVSCRDKLGDLKYTPDILSVTGGFRKVVKRVRLNRMYMRWRAIKERQSLILKQQYNEKYMLTLRLCV